MDSAIRVIDDNFNFLGDIEDYNSFFFIRSYYETKEFQLICSNKYEDILKDKNIIYINSHEPLIIENITVHENKGQLLVKGRSLKSILDRRLIVPPSGQSYDIFKGNAEDVIKHYVESNAVNPINSDRKINQLTIAASKHRGTTIDWQSRFKYLNFEIENICRSVGLGYEITLDLKNKKFIFDVVEGRDLSKSNTDTKVIFSDEFNNITDSVTTNNSMSYKTMGYVAGQGEGTDREVKEVYKNNNIGLDRRELFIDARDIEQSEGDTNDKLVDRANAKLAVCDYVNSTEGTILNINFTYEEDWNLGDIVLRKIKNNVEPLRVVEVTEIYEGYRRIETRLGSIAINPIKEMSNNINNNLSISSGSGGYDKAYTFNQISPKEVWKIPHGLGKYPSITIVDSSGNEVVGDIKYIDINNVELRFTGGFSGTAYLN